MKHIQIQIWIQIQIQMLNGVIDANVGSWTLLIFVWIALTIAPNDKMPWEDLEAMHLLKFLRMKDQCVCSQGHLHLILHIVLIPMICGTPHNSSWLRRYGLSKLKLHLLVKKSQRRYYTQILYYLRKLNEPILF